MIDFDIALTFDDVLLLPAASEVIPSQANTKTRLTQEINLNTPLISSAMDTVTEAQMAIAMAKYGGLGIIHKNLDIEEQVSEVIKVKNHVAGMVTTPKSINEDTTLSDAFKLVERYGFSSFPVVDKSSKLVGILTNRDMRFAKDNDDVPVSHLMSKHSEQKPLITVSKDISKEDAKDLLHEYRIEKLLVVNDDFQCIGMITATDIEKEQSYPDATKSKSGQLLTGAAIGTGSAGLERAEALITAGCDIIVVDTAHGHAKSVIDTVKELRMLQPSAQIIAGNITTKDAAKALIDAGVNALKVGIGPGTICTTRVVAGVGMPQLSAILEVNEIAQKYDIPVIADGGIKFSGDIAKAIAAGASSVMIGSLFAGTDEAPGDIFSYQGRRYKSYRGMGSLSAMAKGSADRYFQSDSNKFVPEGIEGRVPYKGNVQNIIYQLIGGLKSSMGYTGNSNIEEMRNNCRFRRITNAGLKESHVHDVTITKEAPNYYQR